MDLYLPRSRGHQPRTFGQIVTEEGRKVCYTTEPGPRHPPEPTSIPAGNYRLTTKQLATDGPSLVLLDVPGFGDVRLRPESMLGNASSAIVLGLDIHPDVGIRPGTGRAAEAMLKLLVEQAEKTGEIVTLHITDAT